MKRFLLFINKSESKVQLFLKFALIGFVIILIFDLFDKQISYHDILVEFHGLVFDLIVFGVLITIYEIQSDKKDKIQRYKEEVNDYRFWKSEEALFRIRGLVKRLVDLNVKNLDLSHCYLESDNSLSNYNDMSGWKFSAATLKGCIFIMNNLENANFFLANLEEASFDQVNLSKCNFKRACLIYTTFEKCNLNEVNFEGAIVVGENWFDKLEENKNIGVDLLKEKFKISSEYYIIGDKIAFEISCR